MKPGIVSDREPGKPRGGRPSSIGNQIVTLNQGMGIPSCNLPAEGRRDLRAPTERSEEAVEPRFIGRRRIGIQED